MLTSLFWALCVTHLFCHTLCRSVKYLSNFTWLLYLSIILGDLYFIQVQFKLVTCTFTWLHFWRKKRTFYSLQFNLILKCKLYLYLILCTVNMVNGSSNVRAWRENQWSLFSSWLSSDKCQASKVHIKSLEVYWRSKVAFPPQTSLFIILSVLIEPRRVIYWLNAQDWVQNKSVMRI